ncbi:DEAD/DEAH box helicase [bacterium SCSIO 12643]|nr:DEAD/DEAH box helicase [bacterium SCSIO 12643]
MKFDDYRIAERIKEQLRKQGFKRPTDIQYRAITPILRGEDVLAIAQTGTGKTAAFVIPILDILQRNKNQRRVDGIKCVVLAPTRELVLQIHSVFESLGKKLSIKSLAVYGGVEQDPQIQKLEKGIDILVATPGRMFDLVNQKYIHLHRVKHLVLDEADHMLDLGFYKDIEDVKRFLPKKHQTLFFSATINKKIKKLAHSLVRNPIRIQVSPKDPVSKNIEHSVAFIKMEDKRFFLEQFIKDEPNSKILVFVRTKVRAERVRNAMLRVQIHTETIHGDIVQKQREEVLQNFRNGKNRVLIATDVSARGIDIPDVDFVINYDLPDENPETYVHRIGRTGRGKKKGIAVSFCSDDEKEMLQQIETFITKSIKILDINSDDYHDIMFASNENSDNIAALMKEIEEVEAHKKKKAGKKKASRLKKKRNK